MLHICARSVILKNMETNKNEHLRTKSHIYKHEFIEAPEKEIKKVIQKILGGEKNKDFRFTKSDKEKP